MDPIIFAQIIFGVIFIVASFALGSFHGYNRGWNDANDALDYLIDARYSSDDD